MEHQRALLDSIGKEIGVSGSDLSPWYKADFATFRRWGGIGLLTKTYNSSVYLMLKAVYSEHTWIPWNFKVLPGAASRDPEVVRMALEEIAKAKHISRPEDWYQISNTTLKELGFYALIRQCGGLLPTLKSSRWSPFDWDESKFIGQSQTLRARAHRNPPLREKEADLSKEHL